MSIIYRKLWYSVENRLLFFSLDAVIVTSPTDTHADLICRSLTAGIYDKLICDSISENIFYLHLIIHPCAVYSS